ncbi:hypothetical protein FNV43_RR21288 [Rhamnella rubrinervis]|uniref:Reverse transcriptase zinc-binding domain-containing protein n=1 Tax=Rhamnella rubrinervis TaxID=2594499 RepID=A0A8K0E1E5_9ROSA|nr:hypothetical protein FNV43_RR21288 [Rhamnella rubrinervis]
MTDPLIRWSTDKLLSIFPPWLVNKILAIPVSQWGLPDRLVWSFSKTGKLTVKSCYNVLVQDITNGFSMATSSSTWPSSQFWKKLWTLPIAPKIKHFLWRLLHDALTSRANLVRRHVGQDAACPIFFGFRILPATNLRSWIQDVILRLVADQDEEGGMVSLFCYTLWHIWKAQNKFIFEGVSPNPKGVLSMAVVSQKEFLDSIALFTPTAPLLPVPTTNRSTPPLKWVPPSPGFLKINCDGAFCPKLRKGAAGFMVRNWRGDVVCHRHVLLLASDALTIEGQVVFHALLTARRMGFDKIIVETDCANLHENLTDCSKLRCHSTLFISEPSLPELNTDTPSRGLLVRLSQATIRTSVPVGLALTGQSSKFDHSFTMGPDGSARFSTLGLVGPSLVGNLWFEAILSKAEICYQVEPTSRLEMEPLYRHEGIPGSFGSQECPLVRSLAFGSAWGCKLDKLECSSLYHMVKMCLNPPQRLLPLGWEKNDLFIFFAALFYKVWCFKNKKFHEGNYNLGQANMEFNMIVGEFTGRQLCLGSSSDIFHLVEAVAKWEPPNHSWLKINLDAATKLFGCAISMVVRNELGDLVFLVSKVLRSD